MKGILPIELPILIVLQNSVDAYAVVLDKLARSTAGGREFRFDHRR